jgi:hypothetical protein
MSTVTSIKSQNEARLAEEQRLEQRKRSALIIILHHLLDSGYTEAAQKLQAESGINPHEYEVADNIDLVSIIQEFESYYQIKFNRKPKLTRKRIADSSTDKKPKIIRSNRNDNYFPPIGNAYLFVHNTISGTVPNVTSIQSRLATELPSNSTPRDPEELKRDGIFKLPKQNSKLQLRHSNDNVSNTQTEPEGNGHYLSDIVTI